MAIATRGPDADALYRFCYSNPIGATIEECLQAGWKDKSTLLQQVNLLMAQNLLNAVPVGPEGSGEVRLQAIDVNLASKTRGLDDEHLMVLQKIEDTKGQGAWSKTLQNQTKLSVPMITKITKELLKRGLIKEVKSVQFRNRKVFMKIDIQPMEEVSGGRWYHNGEWDAELVDWMTGLCRNCVDDSAGRTMYLREVHEYVMKHPGPRRQPPSLDHVEDIMRSLELDEEVCSVLDQKGERMYIERSRNPDGEPFDLFASRLPLRNKRRKREGEDSQTPGGLQVPCISCRIREQCRVGGLICPEKCEYITAWLGVVSAQDDW